MDPENRVAVALGLENTAATLETLKSLEDRIGLAEVRLDLMQEFDLERLIAGSPCPLVITCRAPREGGSFTGTESERLRILTTASALGCAYVDVEWDCVADFVNEGESTQVIASRHFHDSMPGDLPEQYGEMRLQADVVKLVGFADQPVAALPVLELIVGAESPVIGIAMGEAGLITRLIGPCFESCLLTYAAANQEGGTAPGQIGVRTMTEFFGVDKVGPQTAIEVLLYSDPVCRAQATDRCGGDGTRLKVPVQVDASQIGPLRKALQDLTDRIKVLVLEREYIKSSKG